MTVAGMAVGSPAGKFADSVVGTEKRLDTAAEAAVDEDG